MKSTVFSLLALLAFSSNAGAQSKEPVLMTINGKPVTKSEFEYIYNKNNSNNSLDKKTLEEYVDLFINFKLKVEEAKAQGIDTTASFVNELNGYRSQLTKPYLTDQKVEESFVRDAYERSKEDLDVSHILIRFPQNVTPADTLKAWNEINSIWKRTQKEDFSKLATELSEDPSAKENGGHLGWIPAFRTVYPFETAIYTTPLGKISKPFRTVFGYHIVKVNSKRSNPGEVQVAHIMVFTKNGDDAFNAKAKHSIDSLYACVKAGEDFGTLAKNCSMDKGTSVKNGELPWFGTGQMIPEFETAAFGLNHVGEVSQPVQSTSGWHIIKLLGKKPMATYEEMKPELERKIKRDERASKGQQAFVERLKSEYGYKVNQSAVQDYVKLLEGHNLKDSVFLASIAQLKNPLISYADKVSTQSDFNSYLKKNAMSEKNSARDIIADKLKSFSAQELLAYEDKQLEKKYDDFKFLIQEYHDGILLFEVSNREVWDKASKDNQGLAAFFAEHKADYHWEKPHYKGRVIFCKDAPTFKAAKYIVRKSSPDSIDKYLTKRLNDSIQHVKIEKGLFVQGDNKVVDKEIYKVKNNFEPTKDYPYVFVDGKLLKTDPEDFTDVRGLVTADYQEYLEKEWIKKLRDKYKVVVDQEVLRTVKKN